MFLNQFKSSLQRLAPDDAGLVLAVSGGRDSTVLLHAAAALRDRGFTGELICAHLNHGLRGAESDGDAELVRATTSKLGIECRIETCAPGSLVESATGSLEESARKVRYDFLNRVAIDRQLKFVVTAHHANDQAETVLFNLLRGTGLRGLRGMPDRRTMHNGDVQIIRPMLGISSDVIRDYVHEHGVAFADDATNADDRFARNRIRNVILPMLEEQFVGHAASALLRVAEQAGEALECLDGLADRLLDDAALERTPQLCRLKISELAQAPSFLCRHAMNRLWIVNGWPRQAMTSEHWRRLSGVASGESVGSIDLPGGMRAEVSRGVVRIGCPVSLRR